MKQAKVCLGGSSMVLTLLGSASFAQQGKVEFGKSEYQASYSSCHGASGKGDGVMLSFLTKALSDLTTLAKRSGGVFPSPRISETIDGRTSVVLGSHGAREMPILGGVYRSEDTQPRELHAHNRIAALLDYPARIQQE